MSGRKVWFITGAARGMGVDFVKAALAAGDAVVATGRNPEAVERAVGGSENVLVVKLDITSLREAKDAVAAAVERFGRIDVLIGPMNVTRAVLPVMRKQRSGHVISISSSAGFVGFEFGTAYAASKFGLEGWMESLQPEVAPFGINTTVVNPGFFRTELLTPDSTKFAAASIEDYAERRAALEAFWKSQNGKQGGDPAKLAQALVKITREEHPPRRFVAGVDAIAGAEQKVADFKSEIEAYRDLSTSLAIEE